MEVDKNEGNAIVHESIPWSKYKDKKTIEIGSTEYEIFRAEMSIASRLWM